jgi:hypothetical protein
MGREVRRQIRETDRAEVCECIDHNHRLYEWPPSGAVEGGPKPGRHSRAPKQLDVRGLEIQLVNHEAGAGLEPRVRRVADPEQIVSRVLDIDGEPCPCGGRAADERAISR